MMVLMETLPIQLLLFEKVKEIERVLILLSSFSIKLPPPLSPLFRYNRN